MAEGRSQTLRTALASVVSLLAVLLLQSHGAAAGPVIGVGSAAPFYYQISGTAAAGAASGEAGEATTFTPLSTGAASTTAGYSGADPYIHAGKSALESEAGNRISEPVLSGFRRLSSPGAATPDGNSVFVGTASLRLLDSPLDGATASDTYTMAPANRGAAPAFAVGDNPNRPGFSRTAAVIPPAQAPPSPAQAAPAPQAATLIAAPPPRVAASPAAPPQKPAPADDAEATTLIMAMTVNPAPASARPQEVLVPPVLPAALSNHPARPASPPHKLTSPPPVAAPVRSFIDTAPSATVFGKTSSPAGAGRPAAEPPLSPAQKAAVKAFLKILEELAAESGAAESRAAESRSGETKPAAEGYTESGRDASAFTVWSAPDGSGAMRDATVPVPIMAVGTGGGELPSSLTIFTDESASIDGEGDSLSYFFHHGITQ